MAIVIKPITVEVSKPNVFQAIAAKQNDSNSRFLKVTFVNEGEKIYITPSAKVTINAERNDGQSNSFFGMVNEDGTATVPIHSWILELPGYVDCDVSIIEEDSKLTSTTFTLLVEEASHGSDDISTDEQYDVLGELINEVKEMQSGGVFGNAIADTVSGTAIAITDISPIEHTLGVKARSKNKITSIAQHTNTYITDGVITQINADTRAGLLFKVVATTNGVTEALATLTANEIGRHSMTFTVKDGLTQLVFGLGGTQRDTTVLLNTLPKGTYTISWENTNVTQGTISWCDMQIEEGTTATPYTPHIADVSTANVQRYGGNMLDIEGREVVKFGASANTTKRTFTGKGIITGFAYSNYYNKNNVTAFEKHKNGFSFTNVENQNSYGIGFDLKALPNTVYSIYCDGLSSSNAFLSEYDKDGNFLRYATSSKVNGVWRKFTTGENTAWIVVSFQNAIGTTEGEFNNVYFGIDTFAGFEEYTEPTTHPINADGTVEGVTSLYPTTTLISDTEGIVLDAEYNADTKKYVDNKFAELAALIVNS
jgi:hypothetical protein